MQAQLGRMQLAMDPPDIVIRVPRDSAMFYEFWRAPELIDIGREVSARYLPERILPQWRDFLNQIATPQ